MQNNNHEGPNHERLVKHGGCTRSVRSLVRNNKKQTAMNRTTPLVIKLEEASGPFMRNKLQVNMTLQRLANGKGKARYGIYQRV